MKQPMETNPFQDAFGQALNIYAPLVCDIILTAKEICKETKLPVGDGENVRFVAQLLMNTHQTMSVLAMNAHPQAAAQPQSRVMTITKE